MKLSEPLQIIEMRYKYRKDYIDIIRRLKETKAKSRRDSILKGTGETVHGICEIKTNPRIRCIKNDVKEEPRFMSCFENIFYCSYENTIVGWKIKNLRKDEYKGEWEVYGQPLLSKEIKIKFISAFYRAIRYEVEVYVIEVPE